LTLSRKSLGRLRNGAQSGNEPTEEAAEPAPVKQASPAKQAAPMVAPVIIDLPPAALRPASPQAPPSPIERKPRVPQQRRKADIHGTPSIMQAALPKGAHKKFDGSRIRVCVRKRPLSNKEIMRKETDIMSIKSRQKLIVTEPKQKVDLTKYTEEHKFIFDETFDEKQTNVMVYERTAKNLVDFVFNGGKATCFAYGQTGAGKTHTMMGGRGEPGLYILAGRDLFEKALPAGFEVCISFYEIYGGRLFDLFHGRKKVEAREDASKQVVITGLQEKTVENADDLMELIEYGNQVPFQPHFNANSWS